MKPTQTPTTDLVSDPMRPSALLRGAGIYLDQHGWTKGQFFEQLFDAEGPFLPACASGAIMTAAHGYCPAFGWISLDAEPTPEADAAITAMRVFAAHLDPEYAACTIEKNCAYCPSAIDVIGDWNDYDGRTIGEVIETLMDAADDSDRAHPTGGAR
jgi:hypothetical protein